MRASEEDGGGLSAEVATTGTIAWRLKYRFGSKELRLTLGKWPVTTLKAARQRRDEAKALLEEGIDPAVKRTPFERHGREGVSKTRLRGRPPCCSRLPEHVLDPGPRGLGAHHVIEAALAHIQGNSVSQAYDRARYLSECRKLPTWRAGRLEGLHRGQGDADSAGTTRRLNPPAMGGRDYAARPGKRRLPGKI